MLEEVIVAGFGGQGVLLVGELLAEAGLLEGKHVSWIPSYGAEMRGGTAHCMVAISDQPIVSPVVETPSALLIFNTPSLIKFTPQLRPHGMLVINSSLVEDPVNRRDINVYRIPASDVANELKNGQVANMVMMAAYIALSKVVLLDSFSSAMEKQLQKKPQMLPINRQAIEAGARVAVGVSSKNLAAL